MPDNARRVATAVNGYLAVLGEGPDGRGTNGMGQAAGPHTALPFALTLIPCVAQFERL
jgi:hypothetical protein